MNQDELMERLRNPQKFRKQTTVQEKTSTHEQQVARKKKKSSLIPAVVGGGVFFLVLISLLFIFSAQNRADNITRSLDPSVLKGLIVDKTFDPKEEKEILPDSEGADRNVSNVIQAGSTLPVISRKNYNTLTAGQYTVIGAAPWALSINVTTNIADPELLRYLFNQEKVITAFLAREEVAALLQDPAALAQAAADENMLKTFFEKEAAQQVLASEKALEALAGSKLFAHLLISKAAKYYRNNPQQAVKLIQASPTLSALKKNPAVQKAVKENTYLKNIAATLLK